jgi:hypothetical protein
MLHRPEALEARGHGVRAATRVKPATESTGAGLDSVQLRHATGLTSEEYVKQKGWLTASLEWCPLHPAGGCGFARHTSYGRVEPPGAFIARYRCPKARVTFSLLPDCLASRLSSTMAEVEDVARRVEESADSFERTAEGIRSDIQRQGAVRWVRRRVTAVCVALLAIKGLCPGPLAARQPTLEDFRAGLGIAQVLPKLRELAGPQVTKVPAPIGLGHRRRRRDNGRNRLQQETGADPPR